MRASDAAPTDTGRSPDDGRRDFRAREGDSLASAGRLEEALSKYEEALRADELVNKHHPDVASRYCAIGALYRTVGDNDAATEYFTRAVRRGGQRALRTSRRPRRVPQQPRGRPPRRGPTLLRQRPCLPRPGPPPRRHPARRRARRRTGRSSNVRRRRVRRHPRPEPGRAFAIKSSNHERTREAPRSGGVLDVGGRCSTTSAS